MKRTVSIAVFCLVVWLVFLPAPIVAQTVGVRPMVIDLDMASGSSEEFELIFSPGLRQETMLLTLFKPNQLSTGALTYEDAAAVEYEPATWFTLESNRVVVPPNEHLRLAVRIDVPFGAEGAHTVVIMVEPESEVPEAGIGFRIRYAVRVNINIERPGMRPSLALEDFTLRADEVGNPELAVRVTNTSPLQFPVAAEATIRDETRRLVERVEIKPQTAWHTQQSSLRVYSGITLDMYGPINEPLYPGEYEARLFVRYADGLQVIERIVFEVEEGQFQAHLRQAMLRIEPESVMADLRAGSAASTIIQLDNRTSEDVRVTFNPREIAPEYPRSLFEALTVEVRGQQEFVLPSRRQTRLVFTLRADRLLAPGGYYGYIDIHARLPETDQSETYTVPVAVMVGEGWNNDLEILDVQYDYDDFGYLISASFQNTGDAHIKPRGRMYVKDSEGVILQTIPMALQEGVEWVRPYETGLMIANTADLEPGSYLLDILLTYEGEALAQQEVLVEIVENNSEEEVER